MFVDRKWRNRLSRVEVTASKRLTASWRSSLGVGGRDLRTVQPPHARTQTITLFCVLFVSLQTLKAVLSIAKAAT